jgi:dihydroxyacetone kinase-like predicted kinase
MFGGEDVPQQEAEDLCRTLSEKYPTTEFIYNYGGQAVYDYIYILC